MVVLEFLVSEMIPGAGVPVEQCLSLDNLAPIFASLAFECIVGIAENTILKFKELSESI
jgi:hypothetical protein